MKTLPEHSGDSKIVEELAEEIASIFDIEWDTVGLSTSSTYIEFQSPEINNAVKVRFSDHSPGVGRGAAVDIFIHPSTGWAWNAQTEQMLIDALIDKTEDEIFTWEDYGDDDYIQELYQELDRLKVISSNLEDR
tara:strand:- start:91 stop:492 length:402 start_codon:yes stop_codon:yes gene_type:complete